jgi:hypothetical protein
MENCLSRGILVTNCGELDGFVWINFDIAFWDEHFECLTYISHQKNHVDQND